MAYKLVYKKELEYDRDENGNFYPTKVEYKSICANHAGNYNVDYKIGEIARAIKGTVGLMVFDSIDNVFKFISDEGYCKKYVEILEVVGVGRGVVPKGVIATYDTPSDINLELLLDCFYNLRNYISFDRSETVKVEPPPKGTIAYVAVQVIGIVKLWTPEDQIGYDEPPMDDEEE